jgi:hypothetical protein
VDGQEGLYTLHSVQSGAEAAGKDKHLLQKDNTRVQYQVTTKNAVLRITVSTFKQIKVILISCGSSQFTVLEWLVI